jgi:hypothetical protein
LLKSREYSLLLEGTTVGAVFDVLSRNAAAMGVSAWTLGNLGIESVFERVFQETHHVQVVIN